MSDDACFATDEYARSRYVDKSRTSGTDRVLYFLPGYVEHVRYFCDKKAVDHALRVLRTHPHWPDITIVIPFGGAHVSHTIPRHRLVKVFGKNWLYPALLTRALVMAVIAPEQDEEGTSSHD